ncbi:ribosome-inactivating family protein [Streptomyces mirabilis]|uniref:ribosome-inactivating family protein n=1 Tax=Streptomyces mirabilis TaxID=68239 RepID=UPI0036847977
MHAEDRPEFIRVFMRRSDSYVMGWQQGNEDDGGTVALGDYFVLDPNVQLPGATDATTNRRFQNLANYSDLAQQGATRDGMQITPSSLHNAVLTLSEAESQDTTTSAAARAILQVIVGLAEGSRFRDQARCPGRCSPRFAITGRIPRARSRRRYLSWS